ncbi:MetQ/NlpA family ABC transporter substrate-binding protein [Companilactobacillus mishanensis]|uniref:Lipoprotein n=1 Tax=Companilactobacillus mishanensis TaxID=2486008 RepID=A0ABW9P8L4_9LACO|nr:MetQ/NlpA family ABC transporter substrate-binding protein [Companilactobacillus mishanensis]MQS45444.1 MetQ/NlpA family ABC transporter substrate-binding protein [Companilactobacillus mishanensis]
MKNTIKKFGAILIAALSIFILVGCGSQASADKTKTVKIGITGSDDRILKAVGKKVAKDGIKIKVVQFSDYNQPNTALDQGEIDLNSFQTYIFQDDWNKTHHTNIVSIGETIIAPMRLYSKKISNLSELKKGDKIVVPNDATNEGRALTLLQSAGLITLKDVKLPTVKDIKDNKLKLKISEIEATQTARTLGDETAAVVNSGVASDAKLDANKAVYSEQITAKSKPYVNIISVNKKDQNNPTYKKIIEAYHSDDIAKLVDKYYKGHEKAAWNYKVLQ